MSGRTYAKTPMAGGARSAARQLRRTEKALNEAQARYAEAKVAWSQLYASECQRFGRLLPDDPLVLDVLASVVIADGDQWIWQGTTNNKGLPTFRTPRDESAPYGGERSVVRHLAIAFGVLAVDEQAILYPTTTPMDVNPFHRTLRRGDVVLGNHTRYSKASA